jgi:uncharacterized membrane protein
MRCVHIWAYNEVGSVPKIFFGFSLFLSFSHHFFLVLLLFFFFFFFIPKETKSACFSNNNDNTKNTTEEQQQKKIKSIKSSSKSKCKARDNRTCSSANARAGKT